MTFLKLLNPNNHKLCFSVNLFYSVSSEELSLDNKMDVLVYKLVLVDGDQIRRAGDEVENENSGIIEMDQAFFIFYMIKHFSTHLSPPLSLRAI